MKNIKDFLRQYGMKIKEEPKTPNYSDNDKINRFINHWVKKGFKYECDEIDNGVFEGCVNCNFNNNAMLSIVCYNDEAGGDNHYKINIEDSIYDYFSHKSVDKVYTYYLESKGDFEKEMCILEKAIEMWFELEQIKRVEKL